MRTTRPALLAAIAALAMTAAAATPARAAAEGPPAPARLGIALDAGFPAGGSVALVYRPLEALRVFGGPAWNYVSWGLLGGVALVPFRLAVAPSLSGEVGRYFGADLTHFVNTSSGAFAGTAPLLRDVDATYAAVHLGLEVGSQRGLSFTLRAGLAWAWASSSGPSAPTGTGTQVTFRDARVHATAPSVKLGLQYFF